MKLLHCLNAPKIGGIERLVINLAVEQKSKGIDVAIMLDSTIGEYYHVIVENEIETLISGVNSGFEISLFKFYSLKNKFKNFDIIHFHHFSFIKSLAAISLNTVYTIHGLSKGVRKENIIKYNFREKLKRYFLNKIDVFVANSEYTLVQAKSHYGLNHTKTKVILNGIPISKKNSQNKPTLDEIFTIGLVSRFTFRKRIDRLIDAFNIFLNNGGIGHLVLVGDGEAFNEVKLQIQSLNLEDNIELVGYINNVDMYYKKFHICVHPSDNEGFGLVGVEAYLHGLPVIVYKDSGGLKEVIEKIEPDNIVENEKHLAERLLFYFENREIIFNKAQERKDYAKNNYSIHRMEREYFDVYNLILN